jgi:hypothetical protein
MKKAAIIQSSQSLLLTDEKNGIEADIASAGMA